MSSMCPQTTSCHIYQIFLKENQDIIDKTKAPFLSLSDPIFLPSTNQYPKFDIISVHDFLFCFIHMDSWTIYVYTLKFHASAIMMCHSSVGFSLQYYVFDTY